jgi:hypothetical protein
MRRSHSLLVVVVLAVAPRAFAQQPMSPYGDEPPPQAAPIPPQQLPPVPPPLVAPPPGYQQPYGQQQQYYYQYQQPQPMYSQPPPRLFHEEMQPNYGLMVAGLVIFGASWSINAASAYLADEWKLAVPIIGPFMETQNVFTGAGYEANRMLVGLLVFDGLIETAGAIMLVAGAITHHKVRVYDHARVSVVPAVGPGFSGLAAVGRF